MTSMALGITSPPMPSPGITAMRLLGVTTPLSFHSALRQDRRSAPCEASGYEPIKIGPWVAQLRASGSDEISGNLVGLPIVSRVYLDHLAVLANQDRDQPVNDLAVLLVVRQTKEVGDLAYSLRRT